MTSDRAPVLLNVAEIAELASHFDEHRPRLLAMLDRRIDPTLAARVSAEDVLGEAFLEAHRRWPAFRRQRAMTPYAWLYGIARDRLIEAWRRESRGVRDLRRDLPWPEQSSAQMGLRLVASGPAPSAAAARAEECEQMRHVLGLLREADREILWMRQADDLSFQDVAGVLGVTENAAAVRYSRALKRLEQLWAQVYGGGGGDSP